MAQVDSIRYDDRYGAYLLQELNEKKISLKDFLRETAIWATRYGWNDPEMKPYVYPVKPVTVMEYEQEDPKFVKRLLASESSSRKFFDEKPEILDYYRTCKWADNRNKGNIAWLRECLGHLEGYDDENANVVRNMIKGRLVEFGGVAEEDTQTIEKLKEMFDVKETS